MKYRLFLDDEREPIDLESSPIWVIVRNVDDAMWYVANYGIPSYLSLDHDLGAGKQTGMDFIKRFCQYLDSCPPNTKCNFPNYYVHSQNPIGKENMLAYLACYLEQGGHYDP